MAQHKDYGLIGVGNALQFGKQGPQVARDSGSSGLNVTDENGSTPVTLGGANATESNHFVTKAQLDSVQTAEATFAGTVLYNSGNVAIGTIPAGTKTIITSLTVNTVFDDINATLTTGTSDNSSLLMGSVYNSLTDLGTYQSITTTTFATDTQISVFVPSNTSTQGNVAVVISYY